MSHLFAGLSLFILYLLQLSIFSRIQLINGSVDLILLFLAAWILHERVRNGWLWTILIGVAVSLTSAMPFYVPFFGYLAVAAITTIFKKRVWEMPIITMFVVVFLGSMMQHGMYMAALLVNRTPISILDAMNFVTLPSVLLNLLFSIPMYAIVHAFAERIHPAEA